ncbi:response regulator [Maribacter aestuarii]|uniref:response regulator n=1 Tax=Maribacter aestuarii TaxID=1130723 RepID=UPI0025A66551|nr:response regulator [Maribacter aestuarii]
MKKKLSCVLLIDDDYATNYIHERTIKQADMAEKVVAKQSGYDALDYLRETNSDEYICPEIIFLDINMPGMDGWEFLDEYDKLEEVKKARMVLVMLTTSLNPDDENTSKDIPNISGFKNKPLTVPVLDEIIDTHFPDYR